MPTLTVFTPAYNRRDLLKRCYESLQRQTSRDFVWLVVDDGSSDHTGDAVREWQNAANDFEIRYIYKENGGLHTGYNTAIANADTELCVCIDSDDLMPDNAVERIIGFWRENGSNDVAGIIGLDYSLEGSCIGDPLPEQKTMDLVALTTGRYPGRNGDRKLVIRTELYKSVAPMPTFPGEKNFNPQYMHIKIALQYQFLVLNECLCIVDYQPAGMSASMYRQYRNSPNSFAEIRLQDMSLPGTSRIFKLKKSIHYCSSCILAKRKRFIRRSPCPGLTALAIIPGFFFSLLVRYKTRAK